MDIMYITVKTASVVLCMSERSQCNGHETDVGYELQAVLVSFAQTTMLCINTEILVTFGECWSILRLTISFAAGRIFNRQSVGYFN